MFYFISTLIILTFYLKFTDTCYTFTRSTCPVVNTTKEKVIEIFKEDSEIMDNNIPEGSCELNIVKIINPFQDEISLKRDIIPVCTKCGLCLAIANKLNDTITDMLDICCTDPEIIFQYLETELSTICKTSFQNYDLRDLNGCYVLTQDYRGSVHVGTDFDGQWSWILQEMCLNYLNNMNVYYLYNAIKDNSIDLVKYMCRGEGIFRDCYNINYETTCEKEEHPKCWFKCLCNP